MACNAQSTKRRRETRTMVAVVPANSAKEHEHLATINHSGKFFNLIRIRFCQVATITSRPPLYCRAVFLLVRLDENLLIIQCRSDLAVSRLGLLRVAPNDSAFAIGGAGPRL